MIALLVSIATFTAGYFFAKYSISKVHEIEKEDVRNDTARLMLERFQKDRHAKGSDLF